MSAPFALPDRITIWDKDYTTVLFEGVPARVVPCLMKFHQWQNTGTNTQMWGVSHWVDMEDTFFWNDFFQRNAACLYVWEHDESLIITMQYGGWLLVLRAMYLELRYTNTERYYHRVYCGRISLGEA